MSLWKWNDMELEIDMEDVEFQEKYEKAFINMEKTELKLQKTGSLSQISKEYCKMFYQLFDDIFGSGTGEKLFGGKYNTCLVDEVYDSFISHCKKEVDAANKRRANTVKKYKVIKRK